MAEAKSSIVKPRLFGRVMGLNNNGTWSRKFGSGIEARLEPGLATNGKDWRVILLVFEETAHFDFRNTLGEGAALLERKLLQMARGLKGVPL